MEKSSKLTFVCLPYVEARELHGLRLSNKEHNYEIYKGMYSGVIVSVKDYTVQSKSAIKQFMREIGILKAFNSSNFISLYGYSIDTSETNPKYRIITEDCSVDLRYFLDANGYLPYRERAKIMRDATSGLYAMHNTYANIVMHKKVSSRCFYVSRDGTVKIGSPTRYRSGNYELNFMAYFAHEIIQDIFATYTVKSEIYSLGIVLWEILTGNVPFNNIRYSGIYDLIITKRGMEPVHGPTELCSLVSACRSFYPSCRPDTEYILCYLNRFLQT